MLEWYGPQEAEGGLLATLVVHLQKRAHAAHASDLATGALFAGALGSVCSLMQFLFSPVWGARSDRVGRRPVLLLTIAGNALSYLLLFFSGSFLLFSAGRIDGVLAAIGQPGEAAVIAATRQQVVALTSRFPLPYRL